MEGDRPLLRDGSDGSIDWKLPAFAAGALILAVTLGAWTGWESGNDNEQAAPDRAATLKISPAKTVPTVDASQAAPFPAPTEALPVQRTRRLAAKARTARNRPPLSIELPEQAPAELVTEEQPQQAATEQVVAEAPSVAPTAANMPLPKAVIARTISRIGYACGRVASATAIEGDAPGVFKVTCTSGHSYRAAPVRGRYHFRRLGGR